MPARNRVTPTGEIVAIPLRCAWMGNRGILHEGTEIVRGHGHDNWITCALDFNGRTVPQWRPGRYTVLFFHDEAVAFAAGHRPCGECRRADHQAFRAAWGGEPSAREMSRTLHAERRVPRKGRRLHALPWTDLPDGAFVLGEDGTPALVRGDGVRDWGHEGYGGERRRPRGGAAAVLTPPSVLAALRAGYPVQMA